VSTVEVEYENGKQVEQIVTTPGSVKRLSVGVLVPGRVDAQRMQRVSDIVSMAVGLHRQRGDAIAVHAVDDLLSARPASAPGAGPAAAASQLDLPPAPEAAHAPEARSEGEAKGFPFSVPLAAALAMLVCVLVALLVAAARRRPEPPAMSAEEREKTLAQVRTWVQGEPAHDART
jgi:flagellar M-ring protein FliF